MTKDEARAQAAFEAASHAAGKDCPSAAGLRTGALRARHDRRWLGAQRLGSGRKAAGRSRSCRWKKTSSTAVAPFNTSPSQRAWAGEKELALQQLEAGLRAPAASQVVSYGALKLLPFWDPLRGDPRFEKIVASLAPKQ